jgi:hypothetical protein
LFSWCFGYSAASAAAAEFRLIGRPDSSLRWRGNVPAPSLNKPFGARSVDTDPFALPEIVGRAPQEVVLQSHGICPSLNIRQPCGLTPSSRAICSLKRSGTAVECAEEIGQCSVSMAPRLSEHCRPRILE